MIRGRRGAHQSGAGRAGIVQAGLALHPNFTINRYRGSAGDHPAYLMGRERTYEGCAWRGCLRVKVFRRLLLPPGSTLSTMSHERGVLAHGARATSSCRTQARRNSRG